MRPATALAVGVHVVTIGWSLWATGRARRAQLTIERELGALIREESERARCRVARSTRTLPGRSGTFT